MLMPVTISHYYFDFFSSHSKDFLAQGVLRRFGFSSEYKLPIPNMIGGIYFVWNCGIYRQQAGSAYFAGGA